MRYLPQYPFIPDNFSIGRVFGDFGLDSEDLFGWFPEFRNLWDRRFGIMSGGERRVAEPSGSVRFVSDSLYLLYGGTVRIVRMADDLVRWGY